ncbi:ABC transporter permease [Lapillicoccus jejuensis]|uniref:Peptide/nickel transport system permease protein n=1 Tax=Lapillicoccus jejuensis TaxID=402171 RepID=A0A542DWB6_9MICO|nr:ABC transporter permease [Lapillicoccus jejuensis]TQJ07387.1 peptide/nickel transport system permease protein [Lapillicoccus jejuensis]
MTIAPGQEDTAGRSEIDDAALDGAVAIKGRSPWQIVWSRLKRDKVTMVALVVSVLFLVVGAISPVLQALGVLKPNLTHPDLVAGLGSIPDGFAGGVSWSHLLGVEPGTGRDLGSRIVAGLTTSLIVAVCATIFSVVVGTVVGIISGFAGGFVDWLFSRFLDLVLSFPSTLMLLSLQSVLVPLVARGIGAQDTDPSAKIVFMILVLGFFGFPYFARIIRGQVLSLREREFVEAARSLGAKRSRIYFVELLPHLWAPLLVYTTLVMPANIAAEAALGYLGVGINPPTASLGAILTDAVNYSQSDFAYFLFPGLTVFILVLAFNLLGDGLRDALDPKAGRS